MNANDASPRLTQEDLAEQLRLLTEGFHFKAGPDHAPRSTGSVVLWLARTETRGDLCDYLATLYVNGRSHPWLTGLAWTLRRADTKAIERVGQTNHHGHFRLSHLQVGQEYEVDIEVPTMPMAIAQLEEQLAGAEFAGEVHFEKPAEIKTQTFYDDENHATVAELHRLEDGTFRLGATIRESARDDRLACYQVWDADGRFIDRGFIGLWPIDQNKSTWYGEVALPLAVAEKLTSSCYVGVCFQALQKLSSLDRNWLERALEHNHPDGRPAIEAALRSLVYQGAREAAEASPHAKIPDSEVSELAAPLRQSQSVPSAAAEMATALGDGAVDRPSRPCRDIPVHRRDATRDTDVPDLKEQSTTVTLLWTSAGNLQIELAEGFLIPAQGGLLEIRWLSGNDELIDGVQFAGGGERVATFPRSPRMPAHGDRLLFRKHDGTNNLMLEVAIVIDWQAAGRSTET